MSNRQRRTGTNAKSAWSDALASTSAAEGDPFKMLQSDLSGEQWELFRKLREFDGDLVAGLSDSETEMEPGEIRFDGLPSSAASGDTNATASTDTSVTATETTRPSFVEPARVSSMVAHTLTFSSGGARTVGTASRADIAAAYLKGELTFTEFSNMMDDQQNQELEAALLDGALDSAESASMVTSSEAGQSHLTDMSGCETGNEAEPWDPRLDFDGRKKRKGIRKAHNKLDKALQGLMGEANMSFAKGQHDEAVKTCMEVIRLAPNAPEPFRTLGMIYEELGDLSKCLQFYLIAVHLNPGDPQEWVKVAEMSLEQDDPKQAIACFGKALRCDAENIPLMMKRCQLLEKVGEKKKALEAYQSVLRLLPPEEGPRYMSLARDVAKGYRDIEALDRAESTLRSAFAAHPSLILSEDINTLTDIQIRLKQHEKALKILAIYCGVEFLSEGGHRVPIKPGDEDRVDPLSLEVCLVPQDLPVDLRVKLAICLAFLESAAPPFTVVEKVLDESAEKIGDLFLDLADAFAETGNYQVANRFLSKLVVSQKYNLAAVWLRYAECLNAVGDLPTCVEAYRSVITLASGHREARMAMSAVLQQLGRSDEALDVLGIETVSASITSDSEPNQLGDMRLLLQRCLLLYSQKKFDEFFFTANQMLFAHFKDVFSPSHLATILSNRSLRHRTEALRQLHGNELAQRIFSAPKIVAADSGVTVNDMWDIYLKVCYTLMERKDYKQLESFTIAALMTPNFMKDPAKAKEAEFICLLACILNKNGHFAYNFIKEICVKDVNNYRAWNLFCQIITISQDLRHNRFCLRLMFKRPDHLPLGILNGHNSLVAGSYKHSLGEYVAALKQTPEDPLINLLIGVTFVHMASQKFATKRHSLVVQACAFFHQYVQLRGKSQETCYNLGRAMQQLGLYHAAIHYYKEALELEPCIVDETETFDLRREAAFNLVLIYKHSNSPLMAQLIIQKYLTI